MHNQTFIPYTRQSINAEDIQKVSETLSQDLITRGPQVEAFERAMAESCGAQYAVAFNSGTSALMAACFAADVNAFDRLLTPANTFVASVGSATQDGATPVFVDIDRKTGSLNLSHLEFNLQKKYSRGRDIIMAVHFSGLAIDMQAIDRMILNPDTIVIEDAAHALGSHYPDGQKVGSCPYSHMTIFSFHPAKTITTGEGGMVTTNDADLHHRLKLFRNNGIEREQAFLLSEGAKEGVGYYEVQHITGNYHLTEMQAALGLSQLSRLHQFVDKRRKLVQAYRELLKNDSSLELFSPEQDHQTAYHLFVVQLDFKAHGKTREAVMSKLKDKGIGTQVHYIPVYRHPYYMKLCGDISSFFPETEKYYSMALSLPLYYDLSFEEVEYVVKSLKEVLHQ